MQIALPIEQIKDFLSLSRQIKTDEILINKYIKFEIVFGTCFLIKKNFYGYCRYSFNTNEDDCSFLIPIDKLEGMINVTKSKTLKITINETETLLDDGKAKYNCNTNGISVLAFDFIKEESSKDIISRIDKSTIEILKQAKAFAGNDDLIPQFSCIYIDEDTIYSSNRSSLFFKTLTKQFPKISVTQKELEMISAFDYVDYAVINNHNIYIYGNLTYGYIQTTNAVGFPAKQQIDKLTKENYIKINLENFIDYCKYTIGFIDQSKKDKEFETSECKVNNGVLDLVYEDKKLNEINSLHLKILEQRGDDFSFHFQHSIWKDLLSILPYENIYLGNEEGFISVWSDKDSTFIGILPKMKEKWK